MKVPLWLTHAIDDPVVPYQGSVDIANTLEARGRARDARRRGRATTRPARAGPRRGDRRAPAARPARAARSHTLFTTYTAGSVAVNAHFSWGPMYETEVMLDWLFAQSR